jgi:hypothetical protein
VSALLRTVGTGTRSFLIASDLDENVPAQLDGSFGGAPLVVIQSCPSGDAVRCNQLFTRFKDVMTQLRVGPVLLFRPEQAGPVIAQWVRTGTAS